MSRLVARIHNRWSANGSQEPVAPAHADEVAELGGRVRALRRLDRRFAHVRLSGFTEESDGRRVLARRGRVTRVAVPA